jgi:hypothetical protein
MNAYPTYFFIGLLAIAALFPGAARSQGFAVLAKDAVTCTNGTIAGSVGTFSAAPVGSITQTGCPISGTLHVGDPAAVAAFNDFLGQYSALAPRPLDVCPLITGTLAGMILAPGVYCVSAEAKTGVLTLDGPANATWTFKVPSGALTGTNFSVVMAGGGQACNVTWWVEAAATMTTSNLKGSILAGAASTLTGGTLIGRDYAKADATITGTAIVGCTAGSPGPGPGPAPDPRSCSDRVTGGGHLKVGRDKATFGVTAGISRSGKLRGHLTYIDHGSDLKVKGTGVTAYVVVDARTRHIEGTASIDGVAGTYVLDLTDNGEPGKNDRFALTLSSGYRASGTLAGGNIQLHKKHCGHGHDGDHDDDDDDNDHGHGEKEHKQTPKPYGKRN